MHPCTPPPGYGPETDIDRQKLTDRHRQTDKHDTAERQTDVHILDIKTNKQAFRKTERQVCRYILDKKPVRQPDWHVERQKGRQIEK